MEDHSTSTPMPPHAILVDARALALEFSRALAKSMTPEQLALVVSLNASEPDSGVCHSHDFCDANEVMLSALANLAGQAASAAPTGSLLATEQAAWNIARRCGFSESRIATEAPESEPKAFRPRI